MVRVISVDQSVQDFADEALLKARRDVEIGLVIGRNVSGKDYVLQVVRTPLQDGEPPVSMANKGGAVDGKKGKGGQQAQCVFDTEWIIEHAVQLRRILPGGLHVLGIYILCSEVSFQASHSAVGTLLTNLAQEFPDQSTLFDLFAININVSSGQISVKESIKGSLRPCEVRIAPVAAGITTMRCVHNISLKLNLVDSNQQLHKAIHRSIRWEKENRLNKAYPAICGQLPSLEKQVIDIYQENSIQESEPLLVDFLFSFGNHHSGLHAIGVGEDIAAADAKSSGNYTRCASLEISGSIDCRAYVHKREKMASAVEALKKDIENTLVARLDVLVEAAEMAMESLEGTHSIEAKNNNGSNLRHPLLIELKDSNTYSTQFPRRAFISWKNRSGCYCEYLVGDEGKTEALQRLRELVDIEKIDMESFETNEKEGLNPRDLSHRKPSNVIDLLQANGKLLLFLGATVIAIIAILLAATTQF